MAHTSTIISAPISFSDVNAVLGTSHTDLATMCMDSHINMWSLFKPIYSTKITVLQDADFNGSAHSGTSYKNGGGIKKFYNTWSEYKAALDPTYGRPPNKVWDYDKPAADGLCAFRLSDFNGYHHDAYCTFKTYTLFGNVTNINIPSGWASAGVNIAFEFGFLSDIPDGGITPSKLFGDCILSGNYHFYPAVILTYGKATYNGHDCYFVRTTTDPIETILSSSTKIAKIVIDTKEFSHAILTDIDFTQFAGPLQNNAYWTGTIALVKLAAPLDGTTQGGNHHLSSSTEIVRLQYSLSEVIYNDGYCDRRTLQIRQEKWENVSFLQLRVTFTKQSGSVYGNLKYNITKIEIKIKKEVAGTYTFYCDAGFNTPSGSIICGTTSGNPISINNFVSGVNFSGSTGTQTLTYTGSESSGNTTFPPVKYTNTATTIGNSLFNGSITLRAMSGATVNGSFRAGFSVGGQYSPSSWPNVNSIVTDWISFV